ncbi:DUF1540 domain-containing protein [Paenibacillus sp. y28]|uniref:DUF1540 domain-containing protein n=1 Tax=Paenibacillus sp. y28 TaxID=3129110 RepID=UPI003017CD3D
MAKPTVKCSVSNCEYWATGNNCSAESIMIEIDSHASRSFDSEFAQESGHQDTAGTSAETCCLTFKPRQG